MDTHQKDLIVLGAVLLIVVAGFLVFYPTTRTSVPEDIYKDVTDGWRNDGIVLMQHETEGYFACFGCSTPSEGPAMCIDPILEMKQVTETEERYCNENFELVENG
jgi:hypothetical protein